MDLLSSLIAQAEPGGLVVMVDKLARAPLSKILLFAAVLTLVRVAVYPALKNTPIHRRFGAFTAFRFLNEMADALVYASIVVFMLIRPFGIQTFFIPSGSMIDTLRLNDYIVANKFVYRFNEPKVGDIIVFKPPVEALRDKTEDTDFIKRCVGVPGDVVEIRNKKLWRNGKPIDEPYVDYTINELMDSPKNYSQVMPKTEWDSVQIPNWKLVNDHGRYVPVSIQGTGVNEGLPYTAREYAANSTAQRDFLLKAPPAAIPPGFVLMMGDNRNGSFDGRAWGLVPRDSIVGKAWFIWLPFNRLRGLGG